MLQTRPCLVLCERKDRGWALGEAAPIDGLSRERFADLPDPDAPSMRFARETLDHDPGDHLLFPSAFTRGEQSLKINGLVWMGERAYVEQQIASLLERGFRCIKMKVGAADFAEELAVIRALRGADSCVEVRVDANGAFGPEEALQRLHHLADAGVKSIEQPIRPGQHDAMARLCAESPIEVALDEELIAPTGDKGALLDAIRPHKIVLKPTLIGGFGEAEAWIEAAEAQGIGWWATSALESNIGLNALAQWLAAKRPEAVQGLGTGSLYEQNIGCPLRLEGEDLRFDPEAAWDLSLLDLS